MAVGDAAHILRLVTMALDDFEREPIPAAVRRALRIARLRGDADDEARLGLELGYEEYKGRVDERAAALTSFLANRDISAIGLDTGFPQTTRYMVASIDLLCELDVEPPMELSTQSKMRRANTALVKAHLVNGVRSYTFMYLVGCETQLRFATAAETIFAEHRMATDRHLADVAPDVLDQLNAAIERAGAEGGEARTHALTSCRRVLVAVADRVYPPSKDPHTDSSGKERQVGPGQYRNRILAAVDRSDARETYRGALMSSIDDLATRLDRLDALTQKGVHETVSDAEMRHGVIQTYLLAGEVLLACAEANSSGE